MFKALGKLGSQVKSSINLQFFSNLFGSKSKKYDDLGHDEEEVFLDAQEDIYTDTDEEIVPAKIKLATVDGDSSGDKGRSDKLVELDIHTSELTAKESELSVSEPIITEAEIVVDSEVKAESSSVLTGVDKADSESLKDGNENSEDETDESESSDEHADDDDHHISHKDTKQMVKSSKSSNGLVHSASAAVMQKVHRRMNSYSQRQYSKLDSEKDDENENIIQNDAECSQDTAESNVNEEQLDGPNVIKSGKKTKRKKKIAKRTRKAVRGTWKWFKRSMVSYAYIFNFSPTFVVTTTASRTK